MPRNCSETKRIVNNYYDKKIKEIESLIDERVKEETKKEVESLKETKQFRELKYALEEYIKLFDDKKTIIPTYHIENILKELNDDGASAEVYWRNRKSCDLPEVKEYLKDIDKLEGDRKHDLVVLEQYGKSTPEYKELLKEIEMYLRDLYEKA